MVKFNEREIEFTSPDISDRADKVLQALYAATLENIHTIGEGIAKTGEFRTHPAMTLAITAVLNAAIRAAALTVGFKPGVLKQEVITECIETLVKRLEKERVG